METSTSISCIGCPLRKLYTDGVRRKQNIFHSEQQQEGGVAPFQLHLCTSLLASFPSQGHPAGDKGHHTLPHSARPKSYLIGCHLHQVGAEVLYYVLVRFYQEG